MPYTPPPNTPNAGLAFFAGMDSVQQNRAAQQEQQLQRASLLAQLAERQETQRRTADAERRNQAMLAEIQALPPDKRTRENVLPIMMKHGMLKEALPHLKGTEEPKFHPVGSGGLYDPTNRTVIPPAPQPEKPSTPTTLSRLMAEKAALPEGDPRHAVYEAAIRKESETAKQITPTVIQPPQVTTAEVVDPSDPTRMLKVDARTYKGGSIGSPGVIGIAGKMSDLQKLNAKRQINSQGVQDAIDRARDVLTGRAGGRRPTESGVGAAVDWAGSLVGITPSGAAEADKLRVIGGMLVQKVPRFEGPQSNYDVQYYKEVAGRIGDPTLPVERRIAALDEVQEIWGQFEAGKKSGHFQPTAPAQPNATPPAAPPQPAVPASPSAPPGTPGRSGWGIRRVN